MDRATIKQLAAVRDAPAVSIYFPLDTHRPGNTHDPAVVAALRSRAADDLHARVAAPVDDELLARVDAALDSVDFQHPAPGVAVLVSEQVSEVVSLPASVEARVVVGDHFAIRELVAAVKPPVRTVVLSQARTRCVDVDDDVATEVIGHGFPVEVAPPTEADTPHRDFPLDEHEHDEAAKFVFRAVDRALHELQLRDPRPLVLVGVQRDLAYFDEVSTNSLPVIGRVTGNHERASVDELAHLTRPAVQANAEAEARLLCAQVREALPVHAVAGIGDVWMAARAGRGYRLVVELGYQFAAVFDADMLAPAAPGNRDAFDAVDATIEETIRHDGDVVCVPAGSLSDLGGIALLTRY